MPREVHSVILRNEETGIEPILQELFAEYGLL